MSRIIKLLCFVAAFTALVIPAGCEKDAFDAFLEKESYSPKGDMIWDIYPVVLSFVVSDAQGNNLFDESTPGNWLSGPVTATFCGNTYEWSPVNTKAYLAVIKGFYIYPKSYTGSNEVMLNFGELDGTKKWDSDLIVTWPDNSKDIIRVQHAFRWDENGLPDAYTGFKVNGRDIPGGIIRLTK